MKISGDSVLKRAKHISITKTPEYHYEGDDIKSHNEMIKMLKAYFKPLLTKYTPIGFHRSINVNAVHIFQKKS